MPCNNECRCHDQSGHPQDERDKRLLAKRELFAYVYSHSPLEIEEDNARYALFEELVSGVGLI